MKIRKCPSCKTYTFKPICPKCGTETVSPHPASFSLAKYSKYRRASKTLG